MAWTAGARLDTGDRFPALELDLVSGGTIVLPTEGWTVLLIYRGHW